MDKYGCWWEEVVYNIRQVGQSGISKIINQGPQVSTMKNRFSDLSQIRGEGDDGDQAVVDLLRAEPEELSTKKLAKYGNHNVYANRRIYTCNRRQKSSFSSGQVPSRDGQKSSANSWAGPVPLCFHPKGVGKDTDETVIVLTLTSRHKKLQPFYVRWGGRSRS